MHPLEETQTQVLINCAYFQGTGVSPIGARNYCLVCRGRGIVTIPEVAKVCPCCGGSAREPSGFYCIKCKGKGVVSKKE